MHLISMVYQLFVYLARKFGYPISFSTIQQMIILKGIIRVKQWLKAMVMFSGHLLLNSGLHVKLMWPFFHLMVRKTRQIRFVYSFCSIEDQLCKLKFGSWTYDAAQVNLTKRRDNVDTSNYIRSGEWHIVHVAVKRNDVTYPCCPGIYYPDVTIYSKSKS